MMNEHPGYKICLVFETKHSSDIALPLHDKENKKKKWKDKKINK